MNMQNIKFSDGRVLVAQLFNLGSMAFFIIGKLLIAVPLIIFWCAALLAIFSPETYFDLVRGLQTADAETVTEATRTILRFGLIIAFGMGSILLAVGYRFGFRNRN